MIPIPEIDGLTIQDAKAVVEYWKQRKLEYRNNIIRELESVKAYISESAPLSSCHVMIAPPSPSLRISC